MKLVFYWDGLEETYEGELGKSVVKIVYHKKKIGIEN